MTTNISRNEIHAVTQSLACTAYRLYYDPMEPNLTFLVVMNGAFRFASDFLAELPEDWNPRVDFITMSNYEGTKGRTPKIVLEPRLPIKQQHVVVLEDIVDRGDTMNVLGAYLKEHEAKSLGLIALLCRWRGAELDYFAPGRVHYGLHVPSKDFVVGYGLDLGGYHRSGNTISTLEQTAATEEFKFPSNGSLGVFNFDGSLLYPSGRVE